MSPKTTKEFPRLLTMRLDDGMRKRLEEIAAREDRSIGYIARALIREALVAREKKSVKRKSNP